MNCIKKILPVILLTVLTVSIVEAQVNPVYKIMRQRGWTPLTKNNQTKLTGAQMRKNTLISMGYNDSTISNLKKIGVDLLNPKTRYYLGNIKALTASSDCIIIGTVVRKKYPLTENIFFHTIAYVQVEEFLKNDYKLSPDQIPLMIRSGPMYNGNKMVQEGEDTLRIGEHVLLFLSANLLILNANNNKMYDLFNQLINDPIVRFEIFRKYNLKDRKIIGRSGVKSLSDVKEDINKVIKVIRKSKFSGN